MWMLPFSLCEMITIASSAWAAVTENIRAQAIAVWTNRIRFTPFQLIPRHAFGAWEKALIYPHATSRPNATCAKPACASHDATFKRPTRASMLDMTFVSRASALFVWPAMLPFTVAIQSWSARS
jgi:hypothetical protein